MFNERKRTGREVPGQSVTDQQKVQLEQPRTRVFDYSRKQAPEQFFVHIPFVKSISSFNPQPITPIMVERVLKQGKMSMMGVMNQLTSDQAKAAEKVKSTIALTRVRKAVLGRVAIHSAGFGLPQKAIEKPIAKVPTLLDKAFLYINSLGRRVKP